MLKIFSQKTIYLSIFLTTSIFTMSLGVVGYIFQKNIIAKAEYITLVNMENLKLLTSMRNGSRTISSQVNLLMGFSKKHTEISSKSIAVIKNEIIKYDKNDESYRNIPFTQGENEIYQHLADEWKIVKEKIIELLNLYESEGPSAKTVDLFFNIYSHPFETFFNSMDMLIEFHRKISDQWAGEVKENSKSTTGLSLSIVIISFTVNAILIYILYGLHKKLYKSIKDREELLAIVSHDLKNPLSAVLLYAQTLPQIKVTDKEKFSDLSNKIQHAIKQMQRLIADLLDFSKIQVGVLSIQRQKEKPETLILRTFEIMKPLANEKEIEFTYDANPNLQPILCDKERILQTLLNLVENAIKFTPNKGRIHISVIQDKGGLKFSVSDNGPGILEENLPFIFNQYWQAQSSKTSGAGLGLSIAKGIVEAHGGKIWVESQLKVGTTFYFFLPS